MANTKLFPRTLALYLTRRGVSFVCFIHPSMIINWGSRHVLTKERQKNTDTLRVTKAVIDYFRPNVLVIEDVEDGYSRRAPRFKPLYRAIARYGEEKHIPVSSHTRRDIVDVFAAVGATVKHEFNAVIATLIPTLSASKPKNREASDSEVPSQGVFDAAAFGMTFFARTNRLDLEKAMRQKITVIEA